MYIEPIHIIEEMIEEPVKNIYEEFGKSVGKSIDEWCHYEIKKKLGIEVDKERLIKALNNDRDQYDKGFADGYKAGKKNWWKFWKKD